MMHKLFILSLLGAVVFCHLVSESETAAEFSKFVKQYRTRYPSLEETAKRSQIFASNYRRIVEHNLADHDVLLAVNQFADMTDEEFSAFLGHPRKPMNFRLCRRVHNKPSGEIKKVLDWRENNVVARVKNQANCGACWAFGAVGALESLHAIKTGSLVEFSEQELLDCTQDEPYYNTACDGGDHQAAFTYVKDNGISTESEYGYEAKAQKCRKKSKSFGILGCVQVDEGNSEQLLEALNIGPVAIGVSAHNFRFRFYSSGIITKGCGEDSYIDHIILLVGAAIQPSTGVPYWIVKNSWGSHWGERGYVYIMRSDKGEKSVCRIADVAAYPVS